MSVSHVVTEVLATRQDLLGLHLVDYPGILIEDLSLEELHSGKTDEEKNALSSSIREHGILFPILLLARQARPTLLVDGHHRVVLSLKEGYPAPAELHSCFCSPDLWDQFDLCPTIWEAHRERVKA